MYHLIYFTQESGQEMREANEAARVRAANGESAPGLTGQERITLMVVGAAAAVVLAVAGVVAFVS